MTELERLRLENRRLMAENTRLKIILAKNGISWQTIPEEKNALPAKDKVAETKRRIDLFMRLFCTRTDVYAERWENKAGRKGYSPVCRNRWQAVCPKRTHKDIKCYECEKKAWLPFTEKTAYRHMVGQDERGKSYVAGMYALQADSTCKFLVFDFDDHDGANCHWQEEAM